MDANMEEMQIDESYVLASNTDEPGHELCLAVLHHINVPIFCRTHDGYITYGNEAFTRLCEHDGTAINDGRGVKDTRSENYFNMTMEVRLGTFHHKTGSYIWDDIDPTPMRIPSRRRFLTLTLTLTLIGGSHPGGDSKSTFRRVI